MNEIDLTKFVKEAPSVYEKETIKKPTSFLQELFAKNISFTSGFSDKSKEKFFSEMSILFSSGVDIKSALEIIEGQTEKNKIKKIIGEIKGKVTGGDNLSNALQSTGFISAYEFYSIKIGEETGKLPEVLSELARYFQNKIRLRRQAISTMSYPLIVIAIAAGAVLFMMSFVVPMFADVFKRFNTELPAITLLVLKISSVISKYFWLVLLSLIVVVIFLYTQRQKLWFRDITSKIVLSIPFLGNLVKKVYIARFCLSMKLLIASRTTLTMAVDLVSKMINFYPMEISLRQIENELIHGKHLHEALSQFAIFPKRLIALIKVGEEVNKLDEIFSTLGTQYSEEIEQDTKLLGSLVEPLLIIFLGLFVAVILVSMYMPLFRLGTSIY